MEESRARVPSEGDAERDGARARAREGAREGAAETRADAAFARLLALGLAEERPDGVRSSRAWNLALQRASDRLNRRVAETGKTPDGNPLVLAVETALEAEGVSLAPDERATMVDLLVLLELVNMPRDKRVQLGFGHVEI